MCLAVSCGQYRSWHRYCQGCLHLLVCRAMDITYLGHSSFRIKGKNVTIVTDPYSKEGTGFKFPTVKADIVTISHEHDDHNAHQEVSEVHKVVSGPGEYEIKGVTIFGYKTYHDHSKGEERGKNTVYAIDIDGYHVVHLGDLGHIPKDSLIEELGNVDVLMVPVGGKYTITADEANEVVKKIEPKITIPMHYKTPEHNQNVFGELTPVEDFLQDTGLVVEKTDKLVLKTQLAEEDQKVYLLEKK